VSPQRVGPLVYSFFLDYLQAQRGLRPASIKSYRDGIRLFLDFVASDAGRRITRLSLEDLTAEAVHRFLRHLEVERGNQVQTRNQRLTILHTFFEYLGGRVPEALRVAEQVAAIPMKRVAPPETRYLTREEVRSLFAGLPLRGRLAARDRALLLFLYNTGARVQEVADLRVRDLDIESRPRVRLHGKGDKWRSCPLWDETAEQLRLLLRQRTSTVEPDDPVFLSRSGRGLTRFGIYKVVRRHAGVFDLEGEGPAKRVGPHVFRHTTAVHLLDAGVEVNVIRGWLGHVSLETTNRYAEISLRSKEAALHACRPPSEASAAFPRRPVWRNDESLLSWLESL
jgi:integrase/recombinase XerD